MGPNNISKDCTKNTKRGVDDKNVSTKLMVDSRLPFRHLMLLKFNA